MVKYLPRDVEIEVEKWLDRGLSVVLVGPRQSGKTTLLKHLADKHGWKYLTLEDPATLRAFNDIKTFARLHRGILLIDEAQLDPGVGRKLKYLYDVEEMKFIASGSGSFDIKVKVMGELVGRAARLVLLPLDFGEMVKWKTEDNVYELYLESREAVYRLLKGGDDELPVKELPYLEDLWKEYVVYGGYPAIVLAEGKTKEELLDQLVIAYIDRDVVSSLGIRERIKFLKVAQFLAGSVGSPLKKNSAMEAAGVSFQTLENYLTILDATFITFAVPPFSRSLSNLRKAPKIYFYDTGFRNILLGDLRPFTLRQDRGPLLENFVARHLYQRNKKIFYYRTKSGGEVDFVVNNIPVEVKIGGKATPILHNLRKSLDSPFGVIIHLGPYSREGDIVRIPAYFL